MSDYVIEMINITKKFPGIVANDNITLQLKKGEIHALLGENGAGKSTLMSVLFGLYQPEEGYIKKDGKKVIINSPNDATALHIGMVHQHFKLVEIFTVLDNIILGAEPTKYGFIERKKGAERIKKLSEQYGLSVDLNAVVEDITVGMQQRVEILKMLYRDNDILIFDEPTAVLTPQEIDELMKIMKNLAAEGKSILFITHKLNEIMSVADRCTVLRKGKCIGTVNVADTTKEELSEAFTTSGLPSPLSKIASEFIKIDSFSDGEFLSEAIAKSLGYLVLSIITFVVLFIVILIIIKILISVLDSLTKGGVLNVINRILGLALGLVKACVFICVCLFVISVLVKYIEPLNNFITNDLKLEVEGFGIGKYLYENNPLIIVWNLIFNKA